MGWTGYYTAPIDPTAEIARLCTYETEARASAPVKICKRGTTYYVAVRVVMKDHAGDVYGFKLDAENAYTFAAVFLTSRRVDAWGYKDMDETMGPGMSEAPAALLDLLSETTSKYALEWRERCRKNAALRGRVLKGGEIIRFDEPLTFTDGEQRDVFRVVLDRFGARRKQTRFECIRTGQVCRISGFKSRAWVRVENQGQTEAA